MQQIPKPMTPEELDTHMFFAWLDAVCEGIPFSEWPQHKGLIHKSNYGDKWPHQKEES